MLFGAYYAYIYNYVFERTTKKRIKINDVTEIHYNNVANGSSISTFVMIASKNYPVGSKNLNLIVRRQFQQLLKMVVLQIPSWQQQPRLEGWYDSLSTTSNTLYKN